jgi:hypothetical protein
MSTIKGGDKKKTLKGQESFSTGYIAPTMEVINKKGFHFGGIVELPKDGSSKYKWMEYKRTQEIVDLPNGRKGKKIGLTNLSEESQDLQNGFFLFRDDRTDDAYIITQEGKVKIVK